MTAFEMLTERSASSPPDFQTKQDMNPTLLVSWWCTSFALVAILIRVAGRFVRTEKLFREDKIMFWSIIPLLIRMGLVHVILIWGTNNTTTSGLTEIEIRHREIGSKLVLAARIFYAAFLWIAKYSVVEFLKRLVGTSWHRSYEIGMRIVDGFLALTFLAVVIGTLAECHPVTHYWQVVPDPGPRCREGFAQLLIMGTCDIVTDLVLVVFPIPLVVMSSMPKKRKLNLILLFLLSLILVAVTAYRIPSTISRHLDQRYRSLLASLEILAASGVANAIVIGSFLRDRGAKKAKFRSQSVAAENALSRVVTPRAKSIVQHHWGSDEDLVSGLGMSVMPSLQHRNTIIESTRLAPVAPPNHTLPNINTDPRSSQINRNWDFSSAGRRRRHSDSESSMSSTTSDLKLRNLGARTPESEGPTAIREPPTPGKMSFFDVGGLVDSSAAPGASRDSSIHDSTTATNTNVNANSIPRSGSRAFLSDVGGLLSSHPEEAGDPSRLLRPQAGEVHRNSGGGSWRNVNRGGSNTPQRSTSDLERETLPVPGRSSTRAKSSSRSPGPRGDVGPPTGQGPDSLNFSDAGGLLRW